MNIPSKSITIYDIAKEVGVSASTVSRVINNKSMVRESTRELVLEAMRKHNFSPNAAARGLVTQSTRMIGVLISDIRTTQHTDGIYYVEKEFSSEGYSCIIHNTTRNEDEMARYIRELCRWKVEGVVLIGSIYANEKVRRAIRDNMPDIPVVISNGYIKEPNVYGVVTNERAGVSDCVALLARKGRKCPAMLFNQITPSNSEKEEGYREGMKVYYPGQEPIVMYAGASDEEIAELTKEVILNTPGVDALIFAEDNMAFIGIRTLKDIGVSVPKDVAVIGINNSRLAENSVPRLTSLDNVLYNQSVSTAHNLIMLLKGKKIGHKIMLSSKIVEREST